MLASGARSVGSNPAGGTFILKSHFLGLKFGLKLIFPAPVAQRIEHRFPKPGVVRSNRTGGALAFSKIILENLQI